MENQADKFIGTWEGADTITFNSDGTYTSAGRSSKNRKYIISGSKLILERFAEVPGDAAVIDYYFSSDGKVLVLDKPYKGNYDEAMTYWLTKK